MAIHRLPIPGSDDGSWGNVLNDFLSVAHNTDGSLTSAGVSAAGGELTIHKGAASGYAPLDGSSKVPIANLPVGASSSTVAAGNDTRIAGALQSSSFTAKGDIVVATASNTVTNVGVGSDRQVLTADSTQSSGVAWKAPETSSPILLFAQTSGATEEIFSSTLDGTIQVQLTSSSTYHSWWPRWSPDGKRILFRRTPVTEATSSNYDIYWNGSLWTMNADGSNQQQIISNTSFGGSSGAFGLPHWHPNGSDIICTSGVMIGGVPTVGNAFLLTTFHDDGTNITTIPVTYQGSTFTAGVFDPTISPDGKWVVFSAGVGAPLTASVGDLFIVPYPAGGEALRVTSDASASIYHNDPIWSPDMTKIYDFPKVSSDGNHWGIRVRNIDGTGSATLIDETAVIGISRGAINPGDNHIYFTWYDGTQTVPRIASIRTDASNLTKSSFINISSGTNRSDYPDVWYPKVDTLTPGINTITQPKVSLSSNVTVGNTATETQIIQLIVPANFLTTGLVFTINVSGVGATKASPVGALFFRVRMGPTTTALTSLSTLMTIGITGDASVTAKPFFFTGNIVCQAVGTSGTVILDGNLLTALTSAAPNNIGVGNSNFVDTTVQNQIVVTAQWATSNASNTLTAHVGVLKQIS